MQTMRCTPHPCAPTQSCAACNVRAVICSDKTGTLTTNQMSVIKVAAVQSSSAQLAEFDITGRRGTGGSSPRQTRQVRAARSQQRSRLHARPAAVLGGAEGGLGGMQGHVGLWRGHSCGGAGAPAGAL